jgi:two-component system sensor histidine kinase RegB
METDPARAHLRLFARLRAIAVFGQMATVLSAYFILGVAVPLAPLLGASALLALVDIGTFLRLRHPRPVADAELCAQILADVAVLTILLYFSGGATNPFANCYLLLIAYAAGALPGRYVWIIAAACMLCYAALRLLYVPLPLPQSIELEHELIHFGQWVNYTMLAGLVAWFGVRVSDVWSRHHRRAQQEAEQGARDDSRIGLAALAAGAAHEMSTPLSTMSVVVGDLRRGAKPPADWKVSIDMLWQQLQICKRSLSDMVQAADIEQLGRTRSVPARQFVHELVERFQLLRPQVPLTLRFEPIEDSLALRADHTLAQALLNLVNNAADASPHAVELHVLRHDLALVIQVLDRGPGIAPQLRERLGKGRIAASGRGNGVGLFIANSAIERLGGTVRLFDRKLGGTRVQVELPVAAARETNASAHPGGKRAEIR